MSFVQDLWSRVEGIYGAILAHPFLRGLTDGTLSEDVFRYYVVQDALYLRDFARGLALLGAKSPEDPWMMMFCRHAHDALAVERTLHEEFFTGWGLTEEVVYDTSPAPTTLLYTSYLLRVAYERPFYEGLGAFLPCYWIYWEVGKALERRGSPAELYRRWIQTYASEEFGKIVQEILKVMDRVAQGLTEAQKDEVLVHFIRTSKMEYMFWDMGWRREGWPI
jgi:thiaminase/transcriptional activator TenA